jgi:predicted AlkP superfamily pyrophosphatase or phosphodiesterase
MRFRKYVLIIFVILMSMLAGCWNAPFQHSEQINIKSDNRMSNHTKPVILLIIDSLMDKPLQEAIKSGHAPALQFLLRNGKYFPGVVSSFPTMSVTIDSTLLTGTYPDRHRIPGLVWYDANNRRLVNYGSGGTIETIKIGPGQVLQDVLYNLNNVHLSRNVETIHEEISKKKKLSASINALVYRGNTPHSLQTPNIAAGSGILPKHLETFGPAFFSLGSLSQMSPVGRQYSSPWKSFGMNDTFSAQEVKYLIQTGKLPSFTIAYFPELDHTVHKNGPMDIEGIKKADRQLQEILNSYRSWEEAIKNAVWIVMGDSGQTAIGGERETALIRLPSLLRSYRIAKLSEPVKKEDQIILGVNERMAYIYSLQEHVPLSEIVRHLQKDERIDVIAWKEGPVIHVTGGRKDGVLLYRQHGKYIDPYQQTWFLQGDLSILDISSRGNRITYDSYPDALARLYGALYSHPGRYIVVTSKPGCELVGESSPTHLYGGGHGSLHKQDSLVPMIVAGTDTYLQKLRIVDIKDWILRLSNLSNKK